MVLEADNESSKPLNRGLSPLGSGSTASDSEQLPLDQSIEDLLIWSNEIFGSREFVQAKEDFFLSHGKVFPEDHFFNDRMGYYLDMFLFQRPLSEVAGKCAAMTPYQAYKTRAIGSAVLPTNPGHGEALSGFRHSLFQVLKVGVDKLTLADIFAGERLVVLARSGENFRAINKKDIFQGFLYEYPNGTYISRGLVFHPQKVAKLICQYAKPKKTVETRTVFQALATLANTNLRHLRHKHVDPKLIYSNELKPAAAAKR